MKKPLPEPSSSPPISGPDSPSSPAADHPPIPKPKGPMDLNGWVPSGEIGDKPISEAEWKAVLDKGLEEDLAKMRSGKGLKVPTIFPAGDMHD